MDSSFITITAIVKPTQYDAAEGNVNGILSGQASIGLALP